MTDDYTVFQKREDYRENEIWAEEILEHVRQHPGCDRGTFDAISHRDAAEEADRMVNAGKLDRWYTGTKPAYYIPGTYRPPHLIADTEDAQEGVIPLALSKIHLCRSCNTILVVDKNITQHRMDKSDYICRICRSEQQRIPQQEWKHRTGRCQPMDKNRTCSSFLGIFVAERVLAKTFNGIKRMPNNTHGFDFICGKGHKVDVKSSCRGHSGKRNDAWGFHIRNNQIPDYFLCIAFDNRMDLNPEHIWLIPHDVICDHSALSISEHVGVAKWTRYEQPIERVLDCCNIIKEAK